MTPDYMHSIDPNTTLRATIAVGLNAPEGSSNRRLKPTDLPGVSLSRFKLRGSKAVSYSDEMQPRNNEMQPRNSENDLLVTAGPVCAAQLDVQGEVVMRPAKCLLGLAIVTEADGTTLGWVHDLVFSSETNQVVAVVVGASEFLVIGERQISDISRSTLVLWEEIVTLEKNSIVVKSAAFTPAEDAGNTPLPCSAMLAGTQLWTSEGQQLGTLADLCIDEVSGVVTGYVTATGFVADSIQGKRFQPVPSISCNG